MVLLSIPPVPLFTILLGTGLRIGECLGLTWHEVDFKNGLIHVTHTLCYNDYGDGYKYYMSEPKTESGKRTIPMIGDVRKAFLTIRNNNMMLGGSGDLTVDGYRDFVFLNPLFIGIFGDFGTFYNHIFQEYYEYPNKARSKAYAVYQGIYNRCYKRDKYTNYHDCCDGATICKEWLENPELFIDWYLENYYPVKDEIMVVDKNLFGNRSKEYSPENCCNIPVTIYAMIANCKKHNNPDYMTAANLPLGVWYNEETNMYYGEITPFGHDEPTK